MGEDITMVDNSAIEDVFRMFTAESSVEPGPSSLAISTPISLSTSGPVIMTPEDSIADQLASDMSNIDIDELAVGMGKDVDGVGKGKGVARPEDVGFE